MEDRQVELIVEGTVEATRFANGFLLDAAIFFAKEDMTDVDCTRKGLRREATEEDGIDDSSMYYGFFVSKAIESGEVGFYYTILISQDRRCSETDYLPRDNALVENHEFVTDTQNQKPGVVWNLMVADEDYVVGEEYFTPIDPDSGEETVNVESATVTEVWEYRLDTCLGGLSKEVRHEFYDDEGCEIFNVSTYPSRVNIDTFDYLENSKDNETIREMEREISQSLTEFEVTAIKEILKKLGYEG